MRGLMSSSRSYAPLAALLACALGAGASPALAQQDTTCHSTVGPRDRVVSIVEENDMFNSADRDYTQGLGVIFSGPRSGCLPFVGFAADLDRTFDQALFGWLPGVSAPDWEPAYSVTATLAQHMYTPLDISRVNPDPMDRPYAGWLYASIGYIGETSETRTGKGVDITVRHLSVTQFDIGVIGPLSGAGKLQRWWHRINDFNPVNGWDYQLKNEPGVVARHERTVASIFDFGPLDLELSANAGLALGNIMTNASAGAGVRFGPELDIDYGPPRLRPALSWPNTFQAGPRFNFYLFAYGSGRAVVRDIFLDGNTFADSRSVEKHRFVWDYQYGAAVILFRDVKVTVSRIARSEEFFGQSRDTVFDSVSLSVRF